MPAYTDTMQQMMPRSLGATAPATMGAMPNPFEGGMLPLNQNYSSTMQSGQGPSGPSTVTGNGPTQTATQTTGLGLVTDRNRLTTWTLDTLQRMRNFRRPYDQRRAYFYRQYIGQRDRRMYPDNLTPRSNTFVPYPHQIVDAIVSRVHDAFFGIDPCIEARPKGGSPEAAWQMQAV